jgi:hypothetical protein
MTGKVVDISNIFDDLTPKVVDSGSYAGEDALTPEVVAIDKDKTPKVGTPQFNFNKPATLAEVYIVIGHLIAYHESFYHQKKSGLLGKLRKFKFQVVKVVILGVSLGFLVVLGILKILLK